MISRDEKWKADVLAYDPFAGDREESRTLRDRIVVARKPGPCNICNEKIKPGDLVRSLAEIVEDQACTNRFCTPCCDAMAKAADDEGQDEIEKRFGIGYDAMLKREAAARSALKKSKPRPSQEGSGKP